MSKVLSDNRNSKNKKPAIFTVTIHPNEDNIGYWAECPMENGGAFTDGDTIKEVQINMYESVALYLQDDHPDIIDFLLVFEYADE